MLPFLLAQTALAPLIGLVGIFPSFLLLVIRTGIQTYKINTLYTILSAYHIPTFCGALYFSALKKRLLTVFTALIPLLCIALFIIHPVGQLAWVYTLYWFIPVITLFLARQNFFLHALGSTFTTHAVGSVIWLYTHPTIPLYWLELIPVVAFERLLIALSMTALYLGFNYLRTKITLNSFVHVPRLSWEHN